MELDKSAICEKPRFEEVFFGEKAEHFRSQLTAGRVPTPNCVRCSHLQAATRRQAEQSSKDVKLPHSIMVENTSACNLRCLSCRRDALSVLRKRRMMSLDDIRRLATEMKQIGVTKITYHHLGEAFLSKRLAEELRIIRSHNPEVYIQVSTNGMLLTTDAHREAAMLFDHIQVSLDGVNQHMAARYQRGICFEKVLANMKHLVAYRDERKLSRPVIVWKYLLFHWTECRRHQLQAIELARCRRGRTVAGTDRESLLRFAVAHFARAEPRSGHPGWVGQVCADSRREGATPGQHAGQVGQRGEDAGNVVLRASKLTLRGCRQLFTCLYAQADLVDFEDPALHGRKDSRYGNRPALQPGRYDLAGDASHLSPLQVQDHF